MGSALQNKVGCRGGEEESPGENWSTLTKKGAEMDAGWVKTADVQDGKKPLRTATLGLAVTTPGVPPPIPVLAAVATEEPAADADRKSTRLNSSH